MLKQLPVTPETFAADTPYTAGRLRKRLNDMGMTANIPFHPNQARDMIAKGAFKYRRDHLVCPEGKILRKSAFLKKDLTHPRFQMPQFVARQQDCLPAHQKRRYVALSHVLLAVPRGEGKE